MPGFMPGIPLGGARPCLPSRDGRDKPGHDLIRAEVTHVALSQKHQRARPSISGSARVVLKLPEAPTFGPRPRFNVAASVGRGVGRGTGRHPGRARGFLWRHGTRQSFSRLSPRKRGSSAESRSCKEWMPACAGMSGIGSCSGNFLFIDLRPRKRQRVKKLAMKTTSMTIDARVGKCDSRPGIGFLGI